MKNKRIFFLMWFSQWVLWLAFANNAGAREGLIGAIASAASSIAVARYLSHTRERYDLRAIYLGQFIHAGELVISGTWILLRVIGLRLLGRDVPAGIAAVRYRIGTNRPVSRGRCALATTILTLAPNNLVLGILPERRLFLYHTVIPQPLPSFMLKMGAKLESEKRES